MLAAPVCLLSSSSIWQKFQRLVLIITLAMSNFIYVVNPFLYYKMLKQRPVNIPKVAVVVAGRDREMNSSNNAHQHVNNDVSL